MGASYIFTSGITIYALWLFFHDHFSGSGAFTQFMSPAAYGVYIAHYPLALCFKYAYIVMITSLVSSEVITQNANAIYGAQLVFVFLCTSIVLWPLMFYIRKIPGFDRVL